MRRRHHFTPSAPVEKQWPAPRIPKRIISGGQTGVDRAALDIALERHIPCGGWCPKGRRAEDGVIPARYPLRETESSDYRIRTRRNVLDADATLILTRGTPTGGTALTYRCARHANKPCLVIDMKKGTDPAAIRAWLNGHRIGTLNVAGPRESHQPRIYRQALNLLRKVLACP